MIFDKNFDASLWYILASDKKNREKIVDFIKSIPPELFTKIHEAISQYRAWEQSRLTNSDENRMFFETVGDFVEIGNELYGFELNELGLTIDKERKNKENENYYDSVIELFLNAVEDLKYFEYFEGDCVGALTDNVVETHLNEIVSEMECDEREYNLVKTPLGFFVFSNNENARIMKISGRFINVRKMPEDLNMKDLDSFVKRKELSKQLPLITD